MPIRFTLIYWLKLKKDVTYKCNFIWNLWRYITSSLDEQWHTLVSITRGCDNMLCVVPFALGRAPKPQSIMRIRLPGQRVQRIHFWFRNMVITGMLKERFCVLKCVDFDQLKWRLLLSKMMLFDSVTTVMHGVLHVLASNIQITFITCSIRTWEWWMILYRKGYDILIDKIIIPWRIFRTVRTEQKTTIKTWGF
jgi:hypothetical protein